MVYLVKNGSELAAIHYKIDENDLTNFEKVFSIPLPVHPKLDFKNEFYELIFHNSKYNFVESRYPSFTSYGKFIFLFFGFGGTGGLHGVWSTKKQPTSNLDMLGNGDSLRYLCFLDSDYFENGEPVGKFIPKSPSEYSPKCQEETSYLGAFIAFAVID
uniref:Uncharacterized protein n=1 Tax=Panagrolaimus sp. PS1159 TaxID=55785 RepID=A0AC35F6P3_9BILA